MSSGCSCGSSCKCGDNCSCGRSELGYLETTASKPLVVGLASATTGNLEGAEMAVAGTAEGGCKCGDNCTCNPCNCK